MAQRLGREYQRIEIHLAQILGGLFLQLYIRVAVGRRHHARVVGTRRVGAEKAAAVEAAKLAIQTNLDALVQAAESAHASGDLDAIAAVIAQAKSYTTTARRAKLEANLASAQAAVIEAADKLAALHG